MGIEENEALEIYGLVACREARWNSLNTQGTAIVRGLVVALAGGPQYYAQ